MVTGRENRIARYCTMPIRERFLNRISHSVGCWEWTGNKCRNGYGQLIIKKPGTRKTRMLKAHRVAWFVFNGKDPGKNCVLHKCDNPSCVKPDHLFLGTQLDNIKDCKNKGRASSGEAHHWSKLSEDDVTAIRRLHSKKHTQAFIAKRFGINPSTVSLVVNRITWRHI